MNDTKIGKEEGNPYLKMKRFQMKGTHTHTEASLKLLIFTDVLIEKDICDCRNILVKLSCFYVCFSSGDLLIFSVRVSSFFSFFCVIRTFPFHMMNE